MLGRTPGWGFGTWQELGPEPGPTSWAELVQPWGQGCLAQALGLMVKAGEPGMLTAGPARPGGTQVTN